MAIKRTNLGGGASGPTLIVPPCTLPNQAATGAWTAANRAVFSRFSVLVPTTVRYLNWVVGTSSGNIQVGLAQLSGTLLSDYTRIADTGVVACPAPGSVRTDLGSHTLTPGTYAAFMWADNIIFTTRTTNNTGLDSLRMSAHVTGLTTGVPASGTFTTWSTAYIGVTVEGEA